jgi:glycine cleavage system H protein
MKGKGKVALPCNGLDKEAGALAREAALRLVEQGAELVCPVLYQRNPKRFEKEIDAGELLVIDGCKTGCASKLAKERGLKLAGKLNVTEMLKELGMKGGKAPVPDPEHLARLLAALEVLSEEGAVGEEGASSGLFAGDVEMDEFMEGKFIFKVPKAGYFFNENDCWARVEGNRARLGVSDYVQQSASDMVFFEPPEIGKELEQFDDAGSLESTKTALDIISPVSGKVVAVNRELVDNPELINQDPYVSGWAVEIELTSLEEDRGLLMDCEAYLAYLKDKVKKENKEKFG